MIGLVAFLGLAFDTGYLQLEQNRIQTAADGAAAAAVAEAAASGTSSAITTSGKRGAALNGFTDGSGGVTVTINNPPTSGYYANQTGYIEAIVTQSVSTYFMGVVGQPTATVKGRAVAKAGSGGPACIFALDPSAAESFYMNGAFNLSGCGVQVNSTASSGTAAQNAAYMNGAYNVSLSSFNVVGGIYRGGAYNWLSPSPGPTTGASAISDPLAYKPEPTFGSSCTYTNFKLTGASNTTMSPGTYCGGIYLSGALNITLNPGLYVLAGGGLKIDNAAVNLTGTGVTFYNTSTSGYAYAPMQMTAAANITLKAPTSGSTEAMLFFQDRSAPSGSVNYIHGATNATLEGAIYFPNQVLHLQGASNGNYTVVVADKVLFDGAMNLNSNYSSLASGNPLHTGGAAFGE